MQWPTGDLPHLLLTSVSIGTNDGYDLTELPTEYIYALDLNSLSGDPPATLDSYLECLPRLTPRHDDSVRAKFVRVSASLANSFLV
jgi:hypothetical protein